MIFIKKNSKFKKKNVSFNFISFNFFYVVYVITAP